MRRHEDFDPSEQGDPTQVPRSRVEPRWIAAGIVCLLLIVFALQNSERVDVDFLVLDAQVRVVTVILISAALGFVAGWFVGRPGRRRHRDEG